MAHPHISLFGHTFSHFTRRDELLILWLVLAYLFRPLAFWKLIFRRFFTFYGPWKRRKSKSSILCSKKSRGVSLKKVKFFVARLFYIFCPIKTPKSCSVVSQKVITFKRSGSNICTFMRSNLFSTCSLSENSLF
jgi:hypothetical protein